MRRGNRVGIKQNVWIRSNIVFGMCVLTESDKCTLVDVFQQSTSLLRICHVSIDKDIKGFRMMRYECRMVFLSGPTRNLKGVEMKHHNNETDQLCPLFSKWRENDIICRMKSPCRLPLVVDRV